MGDAIAIWVGPGGIVAAIILIVGFLWKVRSEREDNAATAKRVATEASTAAVSSLSTALDQQEKRLTNQDCQIADLSTRLTDNERLRRVAVEHIADRETFAIAYWQERPPGLPMVPELIHADVLAVAPHLRIARMEAGGGDRGDTSAPDEDDEEDD